MSGYSVPVFAWLYQGQVAALGQVYVYKTGTTTLQTIYSDGALTTPISNPLTLDVNGQCKFYVTGANVLRLDGYTAAGALIQSIDPVYPVGATTIGTVVNQATNFTLSSTNNGNNIIATSAITISLPLTTTFSNSFSVQLNAQGGAIILSPFASDKIQQGSVGATYTIPQGSSGELWTDANGNWGINFLSASSSTLAGLNLTAVGAVLNSIPAYASINGCLVSSITGTNTTAAFSISSGQATDSTNIKYIISAGYSWLASNGNTINGTDAASSTLANSTTYHIFLCSGVSGTGTFVSASLTPTLPTGYTTYKRRIGSFNTTGAGAPISYTSIEYLGGARLNYLTTQVLDVNVANLSTTRTLYALSVPGGIKVQPILRYSGNTSGNTTILTSGDETDVAPSSAVTTVPGYDYADSASSHMYTMFLTTNTSSQIGARANGSSTPVDIVTRGWIDFVRN